MNWRTVRTVVAKELRETLRDRRTLMIMIVVPAFLYPALFVLMEQLVLFGQRQLEEDAVRVAVVSEQPGTVPLRSGDGLEVVRGDAGSEQRLRAGELQAVVQFRAAENPPYGTAEVRILYDAASDRSGLARSLVERRLRSWGDSLLARRLEERGLPGSFASPLAVSDSSVATPQELGGYALGRFLPMILILMTVLGAFYPAIDLAAGEKERGTLEPLLTMPVPEDELVAGKFVAVTVIALAAATLNLASMLLTFQAGLFQFARAANIQFHLPLGAVALIFFALALLAVLFASLFLGIAVRSHSFREAQNALTPIYIVSFLPALLAIMPGVAFTTTLALVPIGGVALLFRALATGQATFLPTVVAVGATIVYAMLALVFAVRAFGREDVLFGSGPSEAQRGSLRERIGRWRRSARGVPRPGIALLFTSVVGLLGFYFGVRLQAWYGERGLLLSQLLLIGLPAVLFAGLGRYDVRRTLALRAPSAKALLAALLIVAGGVPVGWLLGWIQSRFLQIPEEFLEAMRGLLTAGDPARLIWLVVLIALVPAICEELVFRGVLLQGLSRDAPMWRAVLLSSLIFGVFHLSFQTAIRFLPTAWIGLLLGYVVWHTRSIYTSMLMHFLNNAVAVVLVSSATLQGVVLAPSGQPQWAALVIGPVLLALGLYLLPKRSPRADERPLWAALPADSGALTNP